MTDNSYQSDEQNTKKRYHEDQAPDNQYQIPRKRVKRQKSQDSQDQDKSTSQTHQKKHKKHKKSKSKHKKHKQHKQRSEKKHKHKHKKSKSSKKDKHKDSESQQQSSQGQQKGISSSILSDSESLNQELKKKLKKIKSSASKQKRSKTPGRIRRTPRKVVKQEAIVSASQDQQKPIELQSREDDIDSYNEKSKQKQQKGSRKKRSNKRKPETAEKKGQFSIDDVIDLDDDQGDTNKSASNIGADTSRRSRQKVDRLTKIKQPVIKNIIVTKNVQNVPVDHHFSKFNECHILQMGGCFYNATLTQSNIVRDDNKFFIIQILQMNHNQQQFYVYSRWGRVGVTGQISELGPLNRQASIRHYNQVVQNKIKIGHYKVVEMNYDDYDTNKKQKGNKQLQITSKLDPRIQQLIKLIFDIRMMNSHMKQIGYDQKRLPLGKLGQKAITDGYNILNKLLSVINDKNKQAFQKKKLINQLSGQFYQCIPHDFGYMNMQTFVLDVQQKIKEKLQILSSLQQIQIYNSLVSEKMSNPQLSQIDQKYVRLNINIAPIIKGSQIWKKLIKYVQNTHAKTHNKYDLEVEEIFQIKKDQMEAAYKGDMGNKMLLWHGSRLTNYVGILSKGLKIAPLQAPSTGYMFGKGLYFADMVSKSANYCLAILLCQVALGNLNQKYQADFNAANLPPGKNSIKGMGQTQPMGGQYLDDVWIPNGKAQPSGVVDSTLLYNQFVVYDPRQIKYRYLFRFKFHFKVAQNILPGIRV